MTLYRFTGSQRTQFPSLQNPDGSGVELDPGDTIELDAEPVSRVDDAGEVTDRHHPGSVWLAAVDDPPAAVEYTHLEDAPPAPLLADVLPSTPAE